MRLVLGNPWKLFLDNGNLKSLIDNEWIYLMVMDPESENIIHTYHKNLVWKTATEKKSNKVSLKNNFVNEGNRSSHVRITLI